MTKSGSSKTADSAQSSSDTVEQVAEVAQKTGWKWVSKVVLTLGAIIGSVTAIATLPSVGHSIWKNALELRDRFSRPDINARATRFSIRCAVTRHPSDTKQLGIYKNCDTGAFAMSILVTFVNEDFVPPSIKSLVAHLDLYDSEEKITKLELSWPRLVRHETINGSDSVVWSAWLSTDFGARASKTQEILFTSRTADAEPYAAFRKAMYTEGKASKWSKVRARVFAKFLDSDTSILILECNAEFKKEYLENRRKNIGRQNQITLACNN